MVILTLNAFQQQCNTTKQALERLVFNPRCLCLPLCPCARHLTPHNNFSTGAPWSNLSNLYCMCVVWIKWKSDFGWVCLHVNNRMGYWCWVIVNGWSSLVCKHSFVPAFCSYFLFFLCSFTTITTQEVQKDLLEGCKMTWQWNINSQGLCSSHLNLVRKGWEFLEVAGDWVTFGHDSYIEMCMWWVTIFVPSYFT